MEKGKPIHQNIILSFQISKFEKYFKSSCQIISFWIPIFYFFHSRAWPYCSLNLVLQIQMQCWNKRFYNLKKLILIMYFIFFVTICIDGDETQKSCALISIMKWSQIDLTPWGSALFIINSSHNGGPWGEVGLLGESSQWVEFSFTSQTKFQICIYYKLETRHHEWHIFPKYQSNKILWYFIQIPFNWVC